MLQYIVNYKVNIVLLLILYLQMLLSCCELALLPAVYCSVNMQKGHVLARCRTMLST